MHKPIEHAIEREAERDIPERGPPKRTRDKGCGGYDGEPDGVQIIFFKISVRMHVMGFVPFPSAPVHKMLMKIYGEHFHQDDGGNDDGDVE